MTFPPMSRVGLSGFSRSLRLLISRSDRRDFVSSKKFDDEWLLWWSLFHDNKSYFNNFTIARGDLFSVPRHFALAHCVSSDFKMSKGIALTFKQRFGRVDILLRQNQKPDHFTEEDFITKPGCKRYLKFGALPIIHRKPPVRTPPKITFDLPQFGAILPEESVEPARESKLYYILHRVLKPFE
ncbi:hypothetical protein JTB14_036430 [Gonioctena quinquepunctata]|nr:hypothetical protein JTB14_036430 [Gonioctena quinquepunctata]